MYSELNCTPPKKYFEALNSVPVSVALLKIGLTRCNRLKTGYIELKWALIQSGWYHYKRRHSDPAGKVSWDDRGRECSCKLWSTKDGGHHQKLGGGEECPLQRLRERGNCPSLRVTP